MRMGTRKKKQAYWTASVATTPEANPAMSQSILFTFLTEQVFDRRSALTLDYTASFPVCQRSPMRSTVKDESLGHCRMSLRD